jgi:phosphatidylglycerol:prolipoprotein diacylglycerol transferase
LDPIAFELNVGELHRPIGNYGVMLSLAMLTGTFVACRAAARAKIDVGATIAIMGFALGGGIAGSWLLFLLVEWVRTGSPMQALSSGGGFVFLGAPMGGAVTTILAARLLHVPIWRLADLAIHAIPTGQALGRIGCFLGGCCFGRPWDGPFAVTYTDPMAPGAHPSVPRHPTPLYESLAMLLLALAFALIPPQRVGDGRRVMAYFACYGVLRIVIEMFRGDAVRGLVAGVISTSQLISLVIALGAGAAFFLTRPRTAPLASTPPSS